MATSLPAWDLPLRQGSQSERLVRGGHAYVADFVRADHVWARVVRSYLAHGHIVDVDVSKAMQLDGVVGAFTASDLGDPVPTVPVRAPGPFTDDLEQPMLAHDRVRYVGEPIALVVAETPAAAEDGAELVDIDLDPLPVATDPQQRGDCPDDRGDGSGTLGVMNVQHGDVASAFSTADLVVRDRYTVARMTGSPIELRGVIAEWQEEEEEEEGSTVLHLWGPTKRVFFVRDGLAALLGIRPSQVVIHGVDVGGMFGVRGEFYPEDFLVPWAARRLGRPVAWTEDRREHMLSINHSRQQSHDFELAVSAAGEMLAFRDIATIDAGAYARPIGPRQTLILAECLPGPYRWTAMDMRISAVTTNKTPVGNMRGPLGTEAAFVRERAIDRAARNLGLDPIEMRRRNLIAHAELPHVVSLEGPHPEVLVYDSGDYAAILDALLELAEIGKLRKQITSRKAAGEWVGLGLAVFLEHTGRGQRESIKADLAEDGLLTVRTGACDLGQDLTGFIVRLADEELGIAPDHVRVLSGDTRADVDARGTFGSRTAIFVGNAVADAMGQMRTVAVQRASSALGAPVEEVRPLADGLWHGNDFLHWKEVAPISVEGVYEGELTWGFGGHVAVVAIDPATLHVTVERLAVAYDCGRVINPQAVDGQLRGGAVFGLGGALFEEIPYDEYGQPLATNLMDYLIPGFGEVPPIQVLAIDDERAPGNPLGVKGIAEAGVLGVAGAVANAVADALGEAGERVTAIPISPNRLFETLTAATPPAAAPTRDDGTAQ